MKKIALVPVLAGATLLAGPAFAGTEFDELQNLAQDQFRDLTEQLGSATSYKAVAPAEPLGTLGFDVSLEVTATELDQDLFEEAAGSDWDFGYLPLPKLHLHKGLPYNLDVAAFYAAAPGTDIRLLGAELRYAILEGGITTPAVAIRAAYTTLQGLDELELDNKSIELTISKGFAMLTPYAGIGHVRTNADAVEEPNLSEEEVDQTKYFAGLNINMGMNLGLEADMTGDQATYSIKTGFRF
ncbi:hypothetical protein Q4485_04540 [Granulosicoccaceae sp. 1_MG-2023]|nr:hypothetical protein [Granulosicoccaceae sp. 1_MG-2023]